MNWVGYFAGQNETSESAHANWKGAILRPQITKGGKQQAFGAEQSKATIGRMPLIRVILKDTVQNQNVALVILKLKLQQLRKRMKLLLLIRSTLLKDITVNCSEDNLIKKLTWDQVEEQILAKLIFLRKSLKILTNLTLRIAMQSNSLGQVQMQ